VRVDFGTKEANVRIQLVLDEAGKKQLDHLETVTGLSQHTDFFNEAITLMDWVIEQRRAGRIIASMDEKSQNYKELVMPALEHAVKYFAANERAASVRG
jgi:hypothetical protein